MPDHTAEGCELRFMLDPGSGYRALGRSGQQGGCEGCLESVAGERRGRRGRGLSSGDRCNDNMSCVELQRRFVSALYALSPEIDALGMGVWLEVELLQLLREIYQLSQVAFYCILPGLGQGLDAEVHNSRSERSPQRPKLDGLPRVRKATG